MTKRGASEFDVRPFVDTDPEKAQPIIQSWVNDPSHHVRRLVSEGTRPRLPWGMRLRKLVADPTPMLSKLEQLRDDPSEYLRRSVANHPNDIAKDHPDLVADIAQSWMDGVGKQRENLVRHACRTLIKQGHTGALAVFGYEVPQIAVPLISVATPTVRYGRTLKFEFGLQSTALSPQKLIIDYVIHYMKADGSLSPKVFKWTKLTISAGETRQLTREHAIAPITTRTYHSSHHAICLRINGQDFGGESFDLEMPAHKR